MNEHFKIENFKALELMNEVDQLKGRLAEREKELRNANRGAETNFKMTDLALKEKAVIQKKADRYREALEKIAANPYNKDYCRGVCPQIAKAALERRDEGEVGK